MGLLSNVIPKGFSGSSWNPLSLPSSSGLSLPKLSSLPGASLLGSKDQAWFKSILTTFGLNGVLATVFSFFLYLAYLKFVKKDNKGVLEFLKKKGSEYVSKVPGMGMLTKVPFLNKLIPSPESTIHVPKGTQSALNSISGIAPGIASKLNPTKWRILNKKKIAEQEDDENYQAGEPYGDPTAMATGIATDLKSMGLKGGFKDLRTLFEVAKAKGKPINDRDMTMEKMIAIATSLPRTSKARGKLTGIIIDTLWKSLQHPPLSYMGNKFQYRTPDGSYNNPLQPDLGKAGSPYARTVPKMKHLHGVPPDPGLLFDLLMARSDETFKENPAGVSSVLFYHATIIIHDVFRTNRVDPSISDTSSYLDLAPLYGSNLEDQLDVRTMQRGLLKPDSFAEKRLLGQPAGVNVMLVMYNRFHNYVADVLLNINENGRFTLRPANTEEGIKAALAQQDEDIFQTARLITNGLYINISLHDYLRGLTNTHHSASDWTLDPRIEVGRIFDPEGVPRGIGNQVSAEFNLLYRFHSVISRRDEKWTNEFMQEIFPGRPLDQLTPQEFARGLMRFEKSIPEDPAERTFGKLKRNANGKFNDAELVGIMKDSMEDPAGLFNARMVPKALRMIEISGILTSRKWNLASLNEMRSFFGLKRHNTFEDINPDPQVADLLRKLYDHPDMVEMYPGLFLEDGKPRMDPGCGGCPPYTVGRAVFSDAVTLVRSDRFLTVDYTASNLTSWGYQEVQQDYDILGGSMFWKLFQRAFPGWFPYNSLHSTQPMFTRKMNEQIAREIGTIDQYTLKDPSPPPTPIVLAKYSSVTKVLSDQTNFHVTWAKNLNDMTPGKKYDSYMLGGDAPANAAQRNLVREIMFSPAEFMQLLSQTSMHAGKELLDNETLSLASDLNQLDIIRDIAIPLNTRIMADLFCLDLKTDENKGGSLNTTELYKHLMSVRTFGFNNFDPALALRRRKEAREGSKVLTETTLKVISHGPSPISDARGILSKATGALTRAASNVTSKIPFIGGLVNKIDNKVEADTGSLRWYGQNVVKELISAGKTPEEAADICWLTAVAGVGAPIGMFADVLNYFLQDENSQYWEAIQNLASISNVEAADKELRKYVLEAQRLTSNQRDIRVCVGATTIDGKQYKPGDVVVALFGPACKDPDAVSEPEQFKLDRPESAYIHLGYGPHACLGREIALTFIVSLVKVCSGLKNLRPAPGKMGALKQIQINGDRSYLNDSWSYLTTDPTTWKVHFDGVGKGVFRAPKLPIGVASDINYNALKKEQDDFVMNKASKLMPNGTDSSHGTGTADSIKSAINGEAAGATMPVLNGVPSVNGVDQQNGVPNSQNLTNGQPQQQLVPTAKESSSLLNRAISDFSAINKKTVGTAHDIAHGFVESIPGGQSASKLTHGIAQNFIPGSDGASGSGGDHFGQT
ncbi:hypothetical protein N7520_005850 [Penicillium odoratum]|uniref:uncharacterized protein n=1 Tax=Penicillium odoratum TaxID=1167516 RepID=UPI002549891C|nr:uncharacterized protein N7520_005850 [Penicillium odoratum]KAJ5758694.1 hypothetical protein N7520_005850 [Penicillium odoratum]